MKKLSFVTGELHFNYRLIQNCIVAISINRMQLFKISITLCVIIFDAFSFKHGIYSKSQACDSFSKISVIRIKGEWWGKYYVPPNWSSADAWAVSPSDLLTMHWYMPRSSLPIPLSLSNSDCLPDPGSCLPSLYHVTKCGPACGCVPTSHLNSALPPKWTLSNIGVTSTWRGAVTINLAL